MAFARPWQGDVNFEQTVDVITEAHIQRLDIIAGRQRDIESIDKNVVAYPRTFALIDRNTDDFLPWRCRVVTLHP
ncbi:hypothetical protein D3C78_1556780 [compost metagenome]